MMIFSLLFIQSLDTIQNYPSKLLLDPKGMVKFVRISMIHSCKEIDLSAGHGQDYYEGQNSSKIL